MSLLFKFNFPGSSNGKTNKNKMSINNSGERMRMITYLCTFHPALYSKLGNVAAWFPRFAPANFGKLLVFGSHKEGAFPLAGYIT